MSTTNTLTTLLSVLAELDEEFLAGAYDLTREFASAGPLDAAVYAWRDAGCPMPPTTYPPHEDPPHPSERNVIATGAVLASVLPRYVTYDPEDGAELHDTLEEAEQAFDFFFGSHSDAAASDGIHESVDCLALYELTPIKRVVVRVQATSDDDTEEGERCRDAGWDYMAALEVEEPATEPQDNDLAWLSCSGCTEIGDYGAGSEHYERHPVHGCLVGAGCEECGGDGVVQVDVGMPATEPAPALTDAVREVVRGWIRMGVRFPPVSGTNLGAVMLYGRAHDEVHARALCIAAGVDPDEMVGGGR